MIESNMGSMGMGMGTSLLSARSSSLNGIQQGFNRVDQAAENIAKVGATTSNANLNEVITESAIELQRGKLQVQASAKSLEVAEKTIGSIIDIKA